MARILMDDVGKIYPNGFHALHHINLEVADGEFVVLVGPSGCGKTTALRCVAGLEDVTEGTVVIGNREVTDVAPKDRNIAMVFQSYALYPNMSVRQNIGFGLRLRRMPKDEVAKRVDEAARILGLTEWLDRKPAQLSGGQRQRVAMGRAIVREPDVFLMDEPLSNLDAKLRVQMRGEIVRIHQRLGVASLYVTHDQVEAMTMGDRVAVMNAGVLQQCDTPEVIYNQPSNLFVADFMGSPPMNLFPAVVSEDLHSLQLGPQTLAITDTLLGATPELRRYAGHEVVLGIRPEYLRVAQGEDARSSTISGIVKMVEVLGSEKLVHFDTGAPMIDMMGTSSSERVGIGESSCIARVGIDLPFTDNSNVQFELSATHVCFFDPETTQALSRLDSTKSEGSAAASNDERSEVKTQASAGNED